MVELETEGLESSEEADGKESIYLKIRELVESRTGGKNIGKTGGREIFNLVVAEIFAMGAKNKFVRLNEGFGSFHVRQYGAGKRRLPSGMMAEYGDREKIRYEEGVVTKALVANGGDLTEAIKVRGTRTRTGEPEKAPAE